MSKKILFETLQEGRRAHVAYTLDGLADLVRDSPTADGAITILAVGRSFDFYRSGSLLDRPKEAHIALSILLDRIRAQIEIDMEDAKE